MRPARMLLAVPLLLACSTFANAQTAPGCGPAKTTFDVHTAKHAPAAPALPPGKALVYFLQDDLKYNATPRPTTRFGIDGAWVGATHANSYFYALVDPGEHHLCASWEKTSLTPGRYLRSAAVGGYYGPKRSTAATGFTAEAGKTYYFRARNILKKEDDKIVSPPEVLLSSLDPDEAQAVMSSFSFSSSHQKK